MAKEFSPEEYKEWLEAQPKKMVVVKGIFKSFEGTVLVAKPTYKNTWQLPGGGVDAGESPEDGLVREFREEFGKEISKLALKIVGTVHKLEDDTLFVLYEYCEPISEDEEFVLPVDELKTYEFVQPGQLSERLPDYYSHFLKTYVS